MRPASIAIPLIAVALAALVVRVAIVEAYAGKHPGRAAAAWSHHPSVMLASGLAEVGNAVREGRPVARSLVDDLIFSATRAPLAPEPFLVRGVEASLRGDSTLAGRAFTAARDRDPRSVAARYFLADHFLKTGQPRLGLREISALTRLVTGSPAAIGPYLAAYARDPQAAGEVRAMLRRNPELEPVVLNALASDSRDASLALSLWSGAGAGDRLHVWQNRLLENLIASGRYREARSAWARFVGPSATEAESDFPGFSATEQGPFGWALASGSSGVAEAESDRQLRIIHYGRDDLVLASRVLMLQPGRYRMAMQAKGDSAPADSLAWTIECLPSGSKVARVSAGESIADRTIGSSFRIELSGCEAQRIRLIAASSELPKKVQVTISDFKIEREGAL